MVTGLIVALIRCLILLAVIVGAHAFAEPVREFRSAMLASRDSPGAEMEVSLPDVWDRQAVPRTGAWRYRIEVPAAYLAGERPALLIARVGNSFEVAVGGRRVALVGGVQAPYPDHSNEPHLIPLPIALHGSGTIIPIDVTVYGEPRRNAGLSAIRVGAFSDLEEEFLHQRRLSLHAAWVISACALVIGAIALMIWLRTRDRIFGLFALGSIVWGARTAFLLAHQPPLPLPLWQFLYYATLSFYLCPLALFLLEVLDCRARRFKTFIRIYLWLTIPVSLAAVTIDNPAIRSVWLLGALAITVGAFMATFIEAMRRPRSIAIVLAAASAAAMFASLRDWWVIQHVGEYATYTYVRFATPFFLLALAWVLTQRYDEAMRNLARLNHELESRVADREREIETLYVQARFQDLRNAKAQEREHLMREMHDGVGGRLATAAAISRKPGVPAALQQAIQDTLQELRLALDVSSPGGQNLNAVLAALRHRLQSGLEAAGFEMTWDVGPLDDGGDEPDATALMHVVRIVQEAITNAVKHSGGTLITVSAELANDMVSIAILDNGTGGPMPGAQAGSARGIANMTTRAAEIGGAIQFERTAAGFLVSLRFPVRRALPPALPIAVLPYPKGA